MTKTQITKGAVVTKPAPAQKQKIVNRVVSARPPVVRSQPQGSWAEPPPIPAAQLEKITKQLVLIFQMEKPPADSIAVVAGSVMLIAVKFHLYKASVFTVINIGKGKKHFSHIHFRTDAGQNVIASTISFS